MVLKYSENTNKLCLQHQSTWNVTEWVQHIPITDVQGQSDIILLQQSIPSKF